MILNSALALALVLGALSATGHAQESPAAMDDAGTKTWLPTLITATPQEGFALAITLS